MKKLLGIVVLSLLLSGNAFAEKVYLNCSFINGSIVDQEYTNEKTIDYKSDVTIDLDLKTNKVLYLLKSNIPEDLLDQATNSFYCLYLTLI